MSEDFDKISADIDRAYDLKRELGIKHVVWSIHEHSDEMFADEIAFNHKNVTLRYGPLASPVMAFPSWKDVWKAADDLVEKSNDKHHVFLEAAQPAGERHSVLVVDLVFGS